MAAIAKAVALLNIVPGPSAPIAHLAIILAPGMDSAVVNGNLSLLSSLALEVRGAMHVVVNVMMDSGDSISGSKAFGALVHGKAFSLEGFLQNSNATSKLGGL